MADSVKKDRILVVDDTPATLEVLQRSLTSQGYQSFIAPNVAEAIRILESTLIDLVITDFKMPRVSGLDLVRHVRENFKETQVVMIAGYPTIEVAVKSVKAGAEEYLTKPFTDEELFSAVRKALDKLHVRRKETRSYKLQPALHGIIGESDGMQKVFRAIAKAASSSATVLILGESGTGK